MKDCVSLEIAKKLGGKWKLIEGFDCPYYVSNDGRVFSLSKRFKAGRLLTLAKTQTGYVRALLSKNIKVKGEAVHRLVAKAFIPNPKGYPHVNHKDSNRANNDASNLEWCTSAMNARHGFDHGKRNNKGKNNPMWKSRNL